MKQTCINTIATIPDKGSSELNLVNEKVSKFRMKWCIHFFKLLVVSILMLGMSTAGWAATKTWDRGANTNNWNDANNWNPNGRPAAGDDVIIPNGFSVTLNANMPDILNSLTIDFGGSLFTTGTNRQRATTITVNGTYFNGSTRDIVVTTMNVNSGGVYQHNINGGIIPTATWAANSTCLVTGMTNTSPSGFNQTFGNFTWNCNGQTGGVQTDGNIVVSGDFTLNAGTFALSNAQTRTLTIAGNYIQAGGIFDFNLGASNTSTMYLAGNFTQTSGAGSMTTAGAGPPNGQIVFNGTGNQTMSLSNTGGVIWVGYTVNSGSRLQLLSNINLYGDNSNAIYYGSIAVDGTLDVGTYTISHGGQNTGGTQFVLNSGATLITANATGVSGSIPSANTTKIFSSGANYEFQGATTGTFTTTPTAATVNDLIINNGSGVALSSNITVNGSLSLVDGILSTSANTLTVANNSTAAISGASSTRFVNGPLTWQLASGQTYSFPVGKGTTYFPFEIAGVAGTAPRLQVEAFTGNAGGTPSGTLSSLSATEYWMSSVVSGTYTNGSVSLTRPSALGSLNAIGRSATQAGTYASLNGSVSGTSITGSDNTGALLGYFVMAQKGAVLSCVPDILDFGYIASGNSDMKTFVLTGATLDGSDVTITGNSTFQVSLNGSVYSNSVTISGYGSSISQTIYVLFGPTTTNTNYTHTLSVSGGNASTQNVNLSGTTILSCTATGTILMEQWNGINGTTVANLTGSANYPANPSISSQLNSFEIPTNTADNYGVRIRGYICAPTTGNYTFWIASDDNSELWLSTDDNPTNKARIATVDSWTNSREWNKIGTQKSAVISLTLGKSYYIEALMKEGGGGDNLAVGWAKPGEPTTVPSEVIPGTVLSPYLEPVTSIVVAPVSATILVGNTVTLTATVGPNNAADKSVIWSSSDNLIATVDASGIVTGVSAGNVTITATTVSEGLTASSSITVEAPPSQPSIISGAVTPCVGTTQIYSVTNVPGVTYAWVLPSGWSGSSTTNSITVTVGAASGNITVTPNNGYDGPSRSLAVTPGTSLDLITSPGSQCFNGSPITINIGASSTSSGIFSWYSDAGGTNLLQQSASAETSSIYTTTISSTQTYYVSIDAGGCTSALTPVSAYAIIPPTLNASAGGSFCVGSTLSLTSSASNYDNIFWEGPNGYYTTVANPTRTNAQTNMSGTYTVTTSSLSGVNLVANGDFQQGNVGFTSAYTNSANLVPEGRYAIVTNPQSVHASFIACGDHSTGSGLQMVINGATVANVTIWQQTVNVVPNTFYQFSYWVQSVVGNNPSQLQLYVNGVAAGPTYTAAVATCNWTQFIYNWSSGAVTSATLELRNQNIVAGGNDFALDDIIFQHTCLATSSVDVYVAASFTPSVTVSADPSTTVCSGENVTFTATPLHGGTTPTYQWLLNGSNIPGATNSTYTTNTLTNGVQISCRMTSSLTSCLSGSATVTSNTLTMTVTDISPLTIGTITQPTCTESTGSVFLSGFPATGTWTLTQYPGGSTSTGSGTSTTVTGLTEGTYTYTFTNTDGCTSALSGNVVINAQPTTPTQPTIIASGATTFCAGGSVTLSAPASSGYLWSTGATSQDIVVTTSGSYTVQVSNAAGCQSVASAAVSVTVNPLPNATLAVNDATIECGQYGSFVMPVSESGVSYQLYLQDDVTSEGSSVNGTGNQISFTVTPYATTTYHVWATSNSSGCRVRLSDFPTMTVSPILVTVTDDTTDPNSCPDFLEPFNANTDFYNSGSTLVSFKVARTAAPSSNWGFHFTLPVGAVYAPTGSYQTNIINVNSGPADLLVGLATATVNVVQSVSEVTLRFHITNTPGAAQAIQLLVNNLWDINCANPTISVSDTHNISAMPAIGGFN